MKKTVFLLALLPFFFTECNDSDNIAVEKDPVELILDYNRIKLVHSEPGTYNTTKMVCYSEITPEGYNETFRILQGNGGYKAVKTQGTVLYASDFFFMTEVEVEGDHIIITVKGLFPEEMTIENRKFFVCSDRYIIIDSEGKYQFLDINAGFFDQAPPL